LFQTKKIFQYLAVPAAINVLLAISPLTAAPRDKDVTTFDMLVAAGAKTCLPNATATVSIRPGDQADTMDVSIDGLPPDVVFNLFVIQVPKAPFGISWYQGDIQTDKHGRGHQQFVGRFNIETFVQAGGVAPAPQVFTTGPFPDAASNPAFNPIQMYHLGLWFDSFDDASAANCPATVTQFNGEHQAGLQVFNTSNFADDHGPLRDVSPTTSKH
jgi:hypothetical protein